MQGGENAPIAYLENAQNPLISYSKIYKQRNYRHSIVLLVFYYLKLDKLVERLRDCYHKKKNSVVI